MELEIKKGLIDIETVYSRTRPCLTVLEHIFVLVLVVWQSFVNVCAHSWSGFNVRLYIQSHTFSHGHVRPLIRSYTDTTSVPVFYVKKPINGYTQMTLV